MNDLNKAFEMYISRDYMGDVTTICRICKVNKEDLFSLLQENKYFLASNGKKRLSVVNYHDAAEEFNKEKDIRKVTYTEFSNKYHIQATDFVNYCKKYYPDTNKFDEHVFDNIDSEEKAYWLGFLFADGYISSDPIKNKKYPRYTIECSLQLEDLEHLEKFRKFFKKRNDLIIDANRCRLELDSKHIWTVLNKYGCTPNKSLILQFPDKNIFKDESLIKDFIRGYWDGDGCLTYKRLNYPTITCISTENFLNKVQKYFNTNKTLYNNSKSNDVTKVLKYNGKEAFEITNILYKNSKIYLTRKYNKYLEYCRIFEKSNILLQDNIGESCDANTEITEETKESSAS